MNFEKIIEKYKSKLPDDELDSGKSVVMIDELFKFNLELKPRKTRFPSMKLVKFSKPKLISNLKYISIASSFILVSGVIFFKYYYKENIPISTITKQNQFVIPEIQKDNQSIAQAESQETTENIKSINLQFSSRGINNITIDEIRTLCINTLKMTANDYGLKINPVNGNVYETVYFESNGMNTKLQFNLDLIDYKMIISSRISSTSPSQNNFKVININKFVNDLEFEIETKLKMLE